MQMRGNRFGGGGGGLGKNQELTFTKGTPKFLQDIKAKIDRDNRQKQQTDFGEFLQKTVHDKREREEMMERYLESFEDDERREEKMKDLKYEILHPEDEVTRLRREGFAVGRENEEEGGERVKIEQTRVVELGGDGKKREGETGGSGGEMKRENEKSGSRLMFVPRAKEQKKTGENERREGGEKSEVGGSSLTKRPPEIVREKEKRVPKLQTNTLSFED